MDQDRRKHKHERSDHGGEDAENVKRSSSPRGGGAIHVDEAVAVENPSPPPALRECNICGKTFTNGKALGGHRRSHFQALKKNINKVNKPPNHLSKVVHNNRASSNNNCGGVGGVVDVDNRTCYVCKKEFPTKNALFGHMRSHPRDWTGLHPPPSSSSSSSEEDSEEEDWRVNVNDVAPPSIDLSKLTSPSWRKTDRRGRKCIGNYEAARNLMYISAADCCVAQFSCNDLHVTPKAKSTTTTTPELLLPCKKREIGESAEGNSVKKIKFVLSGSFNLGNNKTENGAAGGGDESVKTEFSPVKLLHDHDDGGDYFDERKVSFLSKCHDQKNKSIECLKDSSTSHENEAQKYTCDTCGKTFSTFQGLGGHRSIHKLKNKVTEDQENSSSRKMDHETPPVGEATVADEEAGQSRGPKGLDIDLNEPYFDD